MCSRVITHCAEFVVGIFNTWNAPGSLVRSDVCDIVGWNGFMTLVVSASAVYLG